jgi:2-polyprenyl-6-methoxyphenol hydroxylase-like FAD-dependent oxidoreductase
LPIPFVGGPSGLILARLLQLKSISFDLFEADSSPTERPQGGTLDIHRDTGQVALTEAGLFPEFEKYARYDAAKMKFLDKDGTVVLEDSGEKWDWLNERPEIDRVVLRSILLNSLKEGTVKWGKKVVGISELENSTKEDPKFSVTLADGSIEKEYDLVVGADGTWTRVRNLLANVKPFYAGVTLVEGTINNVTERFPELAQRINGGSCFQIGDGKVIIGQLMSGDSLRVYAAVRAPEGWGSTCGINWADEEKSKADLIETTYQDWDDLGKNMVLRSDGPLIVRPLYMLPVDFEWKTRPGYVPTIFSALVS